MNRYREALEFLPPIRVNPNMILIDAYHRLTAWRVSGADEIEAEILPCRLPNKTMLMELRTFRK